MYGDAFMDEQDLIGKEINNYRIIAEINSGASGSVYKAEHTHLKERIVAIKLLHTFIGSHKEHKQFTQEAQFLAVLDHQYILSLLDFGFSEHQPYLITRYAAGGSLRDLLDRQERLSIEKVISILRQIGQALHYAHQQNIIHRDLKPENILFNVQGDALLADFGIATMLSTSSIKHLTTVSGTPPYMAPEQFRGIISKESDQYALGCIAYELVTGRLPFSAPDFFAMGFMHFTEEPAPPSNYNHQLPPATEAAILKAMAKQRGERHPDILAFLTALQASSLPATPKIAPRVLPVPVVATSPLPPVPLPTRSLQTQEVWLRIGRDHFEAKRYAEALAAYDEVILLDPTNAWAYYSKGNTLRYLNRHAEALNAFEQAIFIKPTDALALYGKGNALRSLNRHKEALKAFEQAVRIKPDFAWAHYYKGNALSDLNRHEEALKAFEQAILLDPEHAGASAYRGRGLALNSLKRYEEAFDAFEQAILLDPAFDLLYDYQGDTLKQLGRQVEAEQTYKKARQLRYEKARQQSDRG
jgi:serine/threonine protein kinase